MFKKIKLDSKKLATIGLTALILLGSSLALLALKNSRKVQTVESSSVATPRKEEPKKEDTSFDFAMVGDMLPHDTVNQAAKQADGSFDYLSLISPELQQSFKKSDLRFCNQESPSAAQISTQGYPAFNAPIKFPEDISSFGCNLISLGNNHANDQGSAGISQTLDEWDKLKPLGVSGVNRSAGQQSTDQIFELKGIKVGYVSFNEVNNKTLQNAYNVNMLSSPGLIEKKISNLRAKTDLVVVSVHWGKEDSHQLTPAQTKYAKQISDAGADIIVGTGPHVWQPYQTIDQADGAKTHIFYSIGNGLNSQLTADQLFSGVAILNIKKGDDGKVQITEPRVLPTYMHYVWGSSVGLSQAQLLSRTKLKYSTLQESQDLIAQRNDFKTTADQQIQNLTKYLDNPAVELLQTY